METDAYQRTGLSCNFARPELALRVSSRSLWSDRFGLRVSQAWKPDPDIERFAQPCRGPDQTMLRDEGKPHNPSFGEVGCGLFRMSLSAFSIATSLRNRLISSSSGFSWPSSEQKVTFRALENRVIDKHFRSSSEVVRAKALRQSALFLSQGWLPLAVARTASGDSDSPSI
jgi:hypothetical protein